jgi:hypothetical protein
MSEQFTYKVYADCSRLVLEETDKLEAIEHCKSLHNANPERYHEVYKVYPDGHENGIFQLKPDGVEKHHLDLVHSQIQFMETRTK